MDMPVEDKPECMADSGATARALNTHDIICQIFNTDERIIRGNKKRLSRGDVLRCALVSRAFCEPALRRLWSIMSPPDPLWFLLAPPDSKPKKLTSEFIDGIISERTYADPARWARFMWYARFVKKLRIIGSDLEGKHREVIYALVEHNGGASFFPSLLELQWSPSTYSDSSYFPLFTSRLRLVAFSFPCYVKGDARRADKTPDSHVFLAQLLATSPRLHYLWVNASCQRLGESHTHAMSSFDHLVDLQLICSISATSFRELAAMPRLESLRVGHVWTDEPVLTLSRSPPVAQIYAPRLQSLSISGDCHLLASLFASLQAPKLKAASFSAISSDLRMADLGYVPCLKALATLGTPTTMEELRLALKDTIPPMRMHLAALVNPLLRLRNIKRFALSCPQLRLVADDDDFAALARAWPRLQKFWLAPAYWDSSHGVDGDGDGEDGDGYGDAGGNTVPVEVPTPDVLRLFRDHCPELCELVLPYLDLDADILQLAHPTQAGSPHGLKRLVFYAKTPANGGEGGRGGEPGAAEVVPVLDESEAEEWARYILNLFPALDAGASLADCRSLSPASAWVEVLERVCDVHTIQEDSTS